jgi:hypothetical protein
MEKVLEESKKFGNGDHLKMANKSLKEDCVTMFKTKAVGTEIGDFERRLRDMLDDRFKNYKMLFSDFCKSQVHDLMAGDIHDLT